MSVRWIAGAFAAVGVLAPSVLAAPPSETVMLSPVSPSRVVARSVVGPAGAGTSISVFARGLKPGTQVRLIVRAGGCLHPSASFATAGQGATGTDGFVRFKAFVRFHGARQVAWKTVADGRHNIALLAGAAVVACGVIPGMS